MNRKTVAIFGSTGQLGTDLVEVLRQSENFGVLPLTHADADCADSKAVQNILLSSRPQIVINSAAYVRVDDCEDHPEDAFRVNAIGALNIARACAEVDALCVYVSTDYVFDGTKDTPYVESDPTCPINIYGASKLAGEFLVRQAAPDWLIVRVASLFGKTGARGKGGNFIETILNKAKQGEAIKVVDDIRISPTYTRDAAVAIAQLLGGGMTGIMHAANSGSCTWYDFAKTALEMCNLPAQITPVSSAAYPMRARRPKHSALGSERSISELRQLMPGWEQALLSYLTERNHAGPSLRTRLAPC